MIYLVSESEVEKTQELFCGNETLFDLSADKYLKRIVTSPNQLIEKIQIFDAGKDDRIVELIKLIVTDYLHQNCPDKEFDELFFATDDSEKNILFLNLHRPLLIQLFSSCLFLKSSYDLYKWP